MENQKEKILVDNMKKINIELSEKQVKQFLKYYDILIEWNAFINLTAITEYEEVVVKHFVDSLSIINIIDLNKKDYSVIDIGTGAGFPGIPLKIIYPHLKITLLDSLNKRIKFLNEVINCLEINEIELLHGRAEDYAHKNEYREQYDFVISRAVANLSTLSEYCLPYIKVGGFFISYKSEKIKEESKEANNAIYLLGGEFYKEEKFTLSDLEHYRSLYMIKKITEMNKKFPRKAGVPSKKPI